MRAKGVPLCPAVPPRRLIQHTLLALAILAGIAALDGAAAPDPLPADDRLLTARRDIEAALICQCGCTMVVNVCDCGTAEQIRADITEKLKSGMDKEAILASYVQQYGKEVLAAPPKEGFDLTAWVTPFAVMAAGGALLYLLLRRWVPRRGGKVPQAVDEPELAPAERLRYEARLEEELKKYF